jgi:hypothetical protein
MPAHSKVLGRIATFAASATLGCLALAKGPAQAVLITIGGEDYDVQRVNTSYDIYKLTMEQEPWWGNRTRAINFSNTVAGGLGTIPAFGGWSGPIFAYGIDYSGGHPLRGISYGYGNTASYFGETLDFATATKVQTPLPAPFLATVAAFRFSRRIRSRLQGRRQSTTVGELG